MYSVYKMNYIDIIEFKNNLKVHMKTKGLYINDIIKSYKFIGYIPIANEHIVNSLLKIRYIYSIRKVV